MFTFPRIFLSAVGACLILAAPLPAKPTLVIIVSPIPRNVWQDGKTARADRDYGRWAREAAAAEKGGVH